MSSHTQTLSSKLLLLLLFCIFSTTNILAGNSEKKKQHYSKKNKSLISYITTDFDTGSIVIHGNNLTNDDDNDDENDQPRQPRVTLGGNQPGYELLISSYSSTAIYAMLPPGIVSGDYLLSIMRSDSDEHAAITYNLTLGAIGTEGFVGLSGADGATGLQGPIGPQGPTGPTGQPGQNGKDGLAGADGKQGSVGPAGTNGINGINAADRSADICRLFDTLNTVYAANIAVPNYCATGLSVNNTGPVGYSVGDTGPAGGIVFYVATGGLHGLEAAPVDQVIARWGIYGNPVSGATGSIIGTGAQNTLDIIARYFDLTSSAAYIADTYALNGYTDWFLPSKAELNLLFQQRAIIGGFSDQRYWSSTKQGTSGFNAWYHDFKTNTQGNDVSTNTPYFVRAIRSF